MKECKPSPVQAPDLVEVRHWDPERRPSGGPFVMEVTDLRAQSGPLCVDLAPQSGEIDDIMGASFEVNNLPGGPETACMHLHFTPDELALSIFKHGDKYILRPERGVSIVATVLPDGESAYVCALTQVDDSSTQFAAESVALAGPCRGITDEWPSDEELHAMRRERRRKKRKALNRWRRRRARAARKRTARAG
jgi:hypothetical protein